MTRLMVDEQTLAKLHHLQELLELCDQSGRTLGYFHPFAGSEHGGLHNARSPFTDEELRKRRAQRTGSPLADVLKRLGES